MSDTLELALRRLRQQLESVSETPTLDSQVLLAHLLDKSRAWVLAHPEVIMTPQQLDSLQRAAARLERGEPLPYILGCWEFYGLKLEVTPEVLIPRPETELLVERALAWLRLHPERRLVADIGAGSGCIAVALSYHLQDLYVIAADRSLPALRVARRNVHRHGLQDRISLLCAYLLDPFERRSLDLLCANLPYIPSQTLQELPVAQWEPVSALHGGDDGLDIIRRMLLQTPAVLAPGGRALLEIEAGQGPTVVQIARRLFPAGQIVLLPDLSGRDRLLQIQT